MKSSGSSWVYLMNYCLCIYVIHVCISRSLHFKAFAKHCTHCFRLPNTLEPVIYDVKLTLNSDLKYIRGQVLIEIQCKENTSLIQLHGNSLFLNIQHATLENRLTNETVDLKKPILNWRDEVVQFRLEEPLKQASVYYLQIWYTTRYADDGHGLMRHQDLERGTWINSLFEPVFARRLLPCFDEPKWRTAFKLELWLIGKFAQRSFIALSNTPATSVTVWNENLTIYEFQPTPPLPIYLFSFAVGQFTSHCNATALLDKEICIWRFSHLQDWQEMAQNIIQAMSLYQEGMTDYLLADPVARLHLLIVPMKLNGMENYGLLNVKEALWPKANDENSFYTFSKTLYHEMAHQWFGNLVTIDWWDSIWLAEGLTTFASSLRPIVHEPSHDLTKEPLVDSKWLLQARIPPISYTKSAALLEMLESLIGSWRMQKLFRDYVRNFQFHWANSQKFLDLMNSSLSTEDFSPARAIEFLDSWLVQGSHPIVFVDFDKSLGQFLFSQTPKIGSGSQWLIPIWLECKDGTVPEKLYWIPKGNQLVVQLAELTTTNSSKKVAFNRNRPVYYQISSR